LIVDTELFTIVLMRRFLIIFAVLVLSGLSAVVVRAQTYPPSPDLPIDGDQTATAGAEDSDLSDYYSFLTPTATTQEAIDDVETGSEVVILAALSLLAGIGLFLIKRYFDLKRYEI